MKVRHPVLLLAILVVSSCGFGNPFISLGEDWNYSFDDSGITFPPSLTGLCSWVASDVSYATDLEQWGYSEYWASPEQTFSTRRGDCEDKAILFMYLARTGGLDPAPELAALRMSDTMGHAVVRVGDSVYDPTYGTWGPWSSVSQPVMYVLNYGETMYAATHDHEARRAMTRPTVPLGAPAH
jgi:hypothetical protein